MHNIDLRSYYLDLMHDNYNVAGLVASPISAKYCFSTELATIIMLLVT